MAKGFWAVPKSIVKRKDLSSNAKFVAGILWTRKNADYEAFPSRKYMAEALGLSIPTIDRAIKELKEKASLKVERRGLRRTNRYSFPDWDEPSKLIVSESSSLITQDSSTLITPNIRDNQLRNTNVDETITSARDVFEYFKEKVKEVKGFEPEIDWGKDGKLAKKRLKKYSLEEIKQLIDWYLSSKHFEKFGASLSICLSTFMINLWKASKTGQTNIVEKFYPTWQYKK
jgi:DNA-binding transcriptional ArsR family regulator